ncbi:MAG: hypothetical protein IPL46_11855 [Saprospiraceae bacterium]|nr:hypothetical protein [Saprospiraceae bacterium]
MAHLGSYTASWLIQFVGTVGTALLFLFLGFAFFVWHFHHVTEKSTFQFKWPKFSLGKGRPDPDLSDEGDGEDDWFKPAASSQKEDSSKKGLVKELDEINKSALEFDLPKAEKIWR